MKYDDFERALKYYAKRTDNDSNYLPYLSRVESGQGNPSLPLVECILDFLNKWQMRLHKTPELSGRILATIEQAQPYIASLKGLRIEDCNLQSIVEINQEHLCVSTAALYVFEMFYAIGDGFVDVATAKTLHLLAPGFFVIWDTSTQSNLTPARGSFAWRYASVFLPRVQADLEALIKETQVRFGLSQAQTIEKLETLGKNRKTLAKLADEYYYSKFTRGLFRRKSNSQKSTQ